MPDDTMLDMVIAEGEACRQIVEGSDYSKCPANMQRVYTFFINAHLANIRQRKAFGLTHFLSGGLGAALMAALEMIAKIKGWGQ